MCYYQTAQKATITMEEATWKQEGAKVCSLNQETWLYRMMMTLNLISKKVKEIQEEMKF